MGFDWGFEGFDFDFVGVSLVDVCDEGLAEAVGFVFFLRLGSWTLVVRDPFSFPELGRLVCVLDWRVFGAATSSSSSDDRIMAVFLRGWRSFPMLSGQWVVVSFLGGIDHQGGLRYHLWRVEAEERRVGVGSSPLRDHLST